MDAYIALLLAAAGKDVAVIDVARAIVVADRAENVNRNRYGIAWAEGRTPRVDR
jgi:hypothetical protein